jgi:hypothetical protein
MYNPQDTKELAFMGELNLEIGHFNINYLQNQPKLTYIYNFNKTCKDKTL